MTLAVPPFTQLAASEHWRTVEFISDLHLQSGEPATFAAWQEYMCSTTADAVFILGDLFDAWVGDDAAGQTDSFQAHCAQVLEQTGSRLALFFMRGNRDFLVGAQLAQLGQFTLLLDPTVLQIFNQRYLLTHGDALCLNDPSYQQFRSEVRTQQWQQTFLAQTLAQRQAIACKLRAESQTHKLPYAEVDTPAAIEWLQAAQAQTMIHGHTHRPADHTLGQGLSRIVLSDWDGAAVPPRAQVLRLTVAAQSDGPTLQRVDLL